MIDHPSAIEANVYESHPCADDRVPQEFQSVGEAVHAAQDDARRLAGETAPKLKNALRTAAYDMAYCAAFGACFTVAFAREITPSAVKDGLARGARAGRDAADKAKSAFDSLARRPADDSPTPPMPAVAPAECPA